ncbi:MAG: LytTR family DNA-binding domain-containing protein [Clostridium sp.]
MKLKIFFDKMINKQELRIQSHPDNKELISELKNYLGQELTVINPLNDRKIQVNLNSILVFQSEGTMCSVKMKNGELYLIKKRLKNIEILGYKDFVKINNQTIINIKEIKEFASATNARLEVVLNDKTSYFVNRHYVKLIKERLL